jgi:hypothetical protein
MLSQNIQQFLLFFNRLPIHIENLYYKQLQLNNWDWNIDVNIMEKSGLKNKTFQTNEEFYLYMVNLSNNKYIDVYPTFLKIMDILNLTELDKQLEKIFLGHPNYNCSN